MIGGLLFFLLLAFFILYIPGRFLLRQIAFSFDDFLTRFSLSLGTGICLFLLGTYVLSWINAAFLYTLLISPVIFLEIKPIFEECKKKIKKENLLRLDIGIIIVGTLLMTLLPWNSGNIYNKELVFFSTHSIDSIYHLSLIGNIINHFPPTHPGLSNIPLRGYNFFYDFFVAMFAKLYAINRFDLFFRFFPLLVSAFFGLSSLALARFLKMNVITTNTFLFLIYFAQNFQFLFTLFMKNPEESFNFQVIQSLEHISDPSVVLSTSLLFLAIICLFTITKKIQTVIPGLLFGVLPLIKIYTAIIGFVPLFILSIMVLFKTKKILQLFVCFVAVFIALITYAPFNLGSGYLIFSPFLLYRHYMESSTFFKNIKWQLQYPIFVEHNNYPRIIFINIVVAITYIFTNLGLRVVSLFLIKKLFTKKFYTDINVFLFIAIIVSFFIPTFFIQSIFAFVVIQFLWIGEILLLIPTAYVLSAFIYKKSRILTTIYAVLLVLCSSWGVMHAVSNFTTDPKLTIDEATVKEINTISSTVAPNESILVLNRVKQKTEYSVPLYAALLGRNIFYEPEVMEFNNIEKIISSRQQIVDTITEQISDCSLKEQTNKSISETLKKVQVEYILQIHSNSCLDNSSFFKSLTKGTISLYKLL
jgi:hypothetical protein